MPTMKDVAKKAGVTLSTVSHALSGKRPISEETRQRIQRAIEELNYHPNELARRLANKQSKIIGLIFPRMANSLTVMQLEFVTGAIEAADQHGYALLFSPSPVDDNDLTRFTHGGLVEGLILMEIRMEDARCSLLNKLEFPYVMIGRMANSDGISFVDLDLTDATAKAVEHLVSLGHKKIAFIDFAASLVEKGYGPAIRSLEGYRNIITKYGLPEIHRACNPTVKAGYEAIQALRQEHPGLTAAVTLNDNAIAGMYQAVQDQGLHIPADFSFAAAVSPRRAEMFIPALTSIDFPASEEGRVGVEILIHRLEQKDATPIQRIIKSELTVRQSSGQAPRQ